MSKFKNYFIGIFGGGLLFFRACLSEERVILNAIKEGEAATISGTKAGLKAENATISEIKTMESSSRLTKENIFFKRKRIDDFLDFILDPEYFKSNSARILKEVLDERHKEPLTNDFEEWYDDEKYDWERISKTIESDLNGKKQLDERFRHMILFQYSNTYFEDYCLKSVETGKTDNTKFIKLKSIALTRGFSPNSNLIKSINYYLNNKN
jgi:hypothetical protein